MLDGLGLFVTELALKDILAQTVPGCVHLTVSLTPVDTQMDRVLPVLQDGLVIIVLQAQQKTV